MNKCLLESLDESWVSINTPFKSNSGLEGTLIARKGKKVIAQFKETGFTREAFLENVTCGKIRDPYSISVYGVAYPGEFEKVPYWKQAKQLWANMLKRCYSEADPRGYAWKGTTVDARWLCFSNFLEDLPKLDNFQLWLKGQKEGSTKYNLDKDFKFPDNNVYSREACMFVTDFDNKSAGGVSRQTKYRLGRG